MNQLILGSEAFAADSLGAGRASLGDMVEEGGAECLGCGHDYGSKPPLVTSEASCLPSGFERKALTAVGGRRRCDHLGFVCLAVDVSNGGGEDVR